MKKPPYVSDTVIKLDNILKFISFDQLAKNGLKRDEIKHHLNNYLKSNLDTSQYLDKLVDDGYIEKGSYENNNGVKGVIYIKKIKGEIFCLKGGYEKEIRQEILEYKLKKVQYLPAKYWWLIVPLTAFVTHKMPFWVKLLQGL